MLHTDIVIKKKKFIVKFKVEHYKCGLAVIINKSMMTGGQGR